MKAIFQFCKPGPTSENFASMTVVNQLLSIPLVLAQAAARTTKATPIYLWSLLKILLKHSIVPGTVWPLSR